MDDIVPLPTKVGEVQRLKGDFSQASFMRGLNANELERRIGYKAGRLREGWWLMFLVQLPSVRQFEYRGYTHMPGGISEGHLPGRREDPMQYPNAEQWLIANGYNLYGTSYQRRGMKLRTIEETFQLTGPQRLAKIRPVSDVARVPSEADYPPGLGVPQWALVDHLRWVAAAFVGPGRIYEGMYA